jgi:hypothetical protein
VAVGVAQKLAVRRLLSFNALVLMLVVAHVHRRGGFGFVLAVVGRTGPGELERQKQREEKHKETRHCG